MKVVFLGDGPWAHEALDLLIEDAEIEVVCIVPRYDTQDPVLRQRAERHGIDCVAIQSVNAPAGLAVLAGYQPDALVSMSFDQIMRRDVLKLGRLGAINCHAGALPFYRGRNVLNWVLINGAPDFGVTVHYMDEGIDTGDIILQRTSPITDEDTYATLLERAATLCATTLHDALRLVANGTVAPIEQSTIHPVGFYTGRRLPGDEWIDWNWTSRRIFDFVRAISPPGPCAQTLVGDKVLKISGAELIPAAPSYRCTAGEVVGRAGHTVHVKTGDTTIALTEVHSEPDVSLRIGARLQSPLELRVAQLEERLSHLERFLGESWHP